jgi:prepilin-type N-terminal cleavage/methylation domain-containing protein
MNNETNTITTRSTTRAAAPGSACCICARSGFTLIEMIIALALIVGLMGSVLVFYRHTTSVRDSVIDKAQSLSARRLVMDRLTDELRSAAGVSNIGVVGSSDQIRFVTCVLPDVTASASQVFGAAPPPPQTDLSLVGYRLRLSVDDQGQSIVEGLERSWQPVLDLAAAEAPPASVTLLAPTIQFISFRYFDGSTWQSQWSRSDLPLAVEVTIGESPLPEGQTPESYPYTSFKRVVQLPSAPGSNPGNNAATQPATQPGDEQTPAGDQP